MDIQTEIDLNKIPKHIAIIMDGNGRWAKSKGRPRVFGHHAGVKAVRAVTEAAAQIGVGFLTLYTFSTENWSRPKLEVEALMALLVDTVYEEINTLMKNNIKLQTIGDLQYLPARSRTAILAGIEKTSGNTGMTLVLALNYSAKWEILNAVKELVKEAEEGNLSHSQIDEQMFVNRLSTKGIPDPELLIRTSGETRISNFLLWQIAYSEFYFTKTFWPDFGKDELHTAILNYQNRERRFGLTSEQLT
jgi:undecaprenyl diphosphate synthase